MTTLCFILGDQLSESLTSIQYCDKKTSIFFMCEVIEEATYVKHHKKKIAFIFSAMRHFRDLLKKKGYTVIYTEINDPKNTGSFESEAKRIIKENHIKSVVMTHPGEYRVLENVRTWEKKFNVPVKILEDERFLCSNATFKEWASKKKQLRMEYFYREMRKKYNILVSKGEPVGGKWNYDHENRKSPNTTVRIPKNTLFLPDTLTKEVIRVIETQFQDHFGQTNNFHYAVTREDALHVLTRFISERLPLFGDYQDAMIENEPWMFHSHIGLYLNVGLLTPLECIKKAEQAYTDQQAPLNAVEGFIRQIMGWREYVRGIYWLKMPEYKTQNFFEAKKTLPDFFWTGKTDMNCLKQCITETKHNAYAHHIQRLMVLGNFCLLIGVDPDAVNEWFLCVYADAYEWVELPNVTGMILFADGGILASKPYAAGGSYINKMSNYCKNCRYKVSLKSGQNACPYNYFYWDFLIRNREKLASNPRISMMYRMIDKMPKEKKDTILSDSLAWISTYHK